MASSLSAATGNRSSSMEPSDLMNHGNIRTTRANPTVTGNEKRWRAPTARPAERGGHERDKGNPGRWNGSGGAQGEQHERHQDGQVLRRDLAAKGADDDEPEPDQERSEDNGEQFGTPPLREQGNCRTGLGEVKKELDDPETMSGEECAQAGHNRSGEGLPVSLHDDGEADICQSDGKAPGTEAQIQKRKGRVHLVTGRSQATTTRANRASENNTGLGTRNEIMSRVVRATMIAVAHSLRDVCTTRHRWRRM